MVTSDMLPLAAIPVIYSDRPPPTTDEVEVEKFGPVERADARDTGYDHPRGHSSGTLLNLTTAS